MQFNLNDLLTFEPTEAGLAIVQGPGYFATDLGNGRWQMQAWNFMRLFGPRFRNGGALLVKDNTVEVESSVSDADKGETQALLDSKRHAFNAALARLGMKQS